MITKTDFLKYTQHPCWLWLSKNQPDLLPPVDDNLSQMFEDGNELEAYAAKRYENVRIGELSEAPGSVAMQCVFTWENFQCRSDLLIRELDKSIHLVEIKSSTRVKPEHLLDLAFQKHVIEANNHTVNKVSVMHVNNSYVRSGEIDPNQLLTLTDVTAEVSALSEDIETQMRAAESTALSDEMPDPSPRHCHRDFKKDWLRIARKLTRLPESCIYEMPYLSLESAAELEDQGILSITDIPDSALKRADQRALKSTLCLSEPIIDWSTIRESLDTLTFPLYFIDYESVSLPVPPYNETKPYQQVVFQYSLHILDDPLGETRHEEYLHTSSEYPTHSLVRSMRDHIGDIGSIIVWNATFEKNRNKEMGEVISEAQEFFENMNSRLFDLMLFFKPNASYKDPRFKGSASIKKVLPVLVPGLTYADLDVQEGQSASRLWRNIVLGGDKMGGRSEEILSSLREYCKFDTLAMVEIYNRLINS